MGDEGAGNNFNFTDAFVKAANAKDSRNSDEDGLKRSERSIGVVE